MIEDAAVDAHDASEQAMGWFTMFESHLERPFDTEVLGVRVDMEAIEPRDDTRIVAVSKRGKESQAIQVTELPAPREKPAGASGCS